MLIPITKSQAPLVFDTLPAIKVRHYSGKAAHGNIYTLAKLYVLGEELALSLYVFEEAPTPESRVAFCVGAAGGKYLRLDSSAFEAELVLGGALPKEVLQTPEIKRFTGQDEQGWYWGQSLSLGKAALQKAGLNLAAQQEFSVNVVKYCRDEAAFGTAFPAEANPFDTACFGICTAVDY